MSGHFLSDFSEMLERQGQQREEREKAMSDRFGEADRVLEEREYWRVEGGVLSFRRRADGVIESLSRIAYTDEFIANLNGMLALPTREL